jgi:hypothetical protein
MSEKQAYRQKIDAKMEEWNAEIDRLEARADRAGADVQLEYYEQIKRLRALQEEARGKLKELEAAGDDAWEDFRDGVDVAANAVERAVDVAAARLS